MVFFVQSYLDLLKIYARQVKTRVTTLGALLPALVTKIKFDFKTTRETID